MKISLTLRDRSRMLGGMANRKNPAAVALGRKGGLKGGRARALKLSSEELSGQGRKAVQARWAKYYAEKAEAERQEVPSKPKRSR
jgi:hypothetical protein